jgi:hypothetical protein
MLATALGRLAREAFAGLDFVGEVRQVGLVKLDRGKALVAREQMKITAGPRSADPPRCRAFAASARSRRPRREGLGAR